jgi:alkanesulfonate monooxygenase SsuD/methylene tetrahydromethanopterin reductase-like flavin-dependent oxidoreductase (luciferase family)
VLAAARFAERAGIDGLFLFDHLIPIGDPARPVLELVATAGLVAASTSSLTVGTLVMRAPLRGPAISESIARTLAMIAPGRTVIGLGAGDARSDEEARRFGQPVPSLEERVAILRTTSDALGAARVPRWIGGLHPRVLDVAATADGWNGWMIDADRLRSVAGRLGSDRSDFEVSWGGGVLIGEDRRDLGRVVDARGGTNGVIAGTAEELVESLWSMVEAGASHLIVSILPNVVPRWELFVEGVVPKLRARWDR